MDAQVISLPTERITDWQTFHEVFKLTLGFPAFYGRNMDAWIDCLTSVDSPEDGLTTITVAHGQLLVLRVDNAGNFKGRCPEQFEALIECSTFVNTRRIEMGEPPVLALLFTGR
jgi:hypothetical protein